MKVDGFESDGFGVVGEIPPLGTHCAPRIVFVLEGPGRQTASFRARGLGRQTRCEKKTLRRIARAFHMLQGTLAQKTMLKSPSSSPKSHHKVFLESQLIPCIHKIQRELTWRRGVSFKECQSPLQQSILALSAWAKEDYSFEEMHTQEETVTPGVGQEAERAARANTQSPSGGAFDDERSQSSHHPGVDGKERKRLPMEDNPQTRERVHSSIATTLDAFLLVISHSLPKHVRSCELSLEGISLIVNNRYLSGRAGGSESNRGILQKVLEGVAECSGSNNETVQTALVSTMTSIVTSPNCSVHESVMLTALRSTFHVYLVTKSSTCKGSAKRALLDMLKAVFFRMEAYDAVLRQQKDASTEDETTFLSQYHADAYYLFRSLCKLSSKELQADNFDEANKSTRLFNTLVPTDPTELNSKLLSLELILTAMDLCGEAFTAPKFVYLIQTYLCGSLLKNCVSNNTKVAFLSQKIFLVLVHKFKGHLKQDIEVFMSNVFFRVLDSQNSSFKQKALVLESLRALCRDPVLLTQIFIEYDCDFDGMNLYTNIVHTLTKLGGRATSIPYSNLSKRDADHEFELSLASIECLVTILRTFLQALSLPIGDDNESNDDSAGARIRGMLQLDRALAALEETHHEAESVISEETTSIVFVPGALATPTVTASPPAEATNVAGKIVDAFDRKQIAQQNFEIGAVKFTLSLKTGLRFFIDNEFVELDAKAVARFFLNNKDKLDKTQMGEALGREPDAGFLKNKDIEADKGGPGFWVRILHHYTDALDFTDLVFDEAIRLFLSGFRLPGEAQKIDRIMEKFAERFTAQNPAVFPSSDTAFILAFSVIMLNTDLHNPSIKPERRMTMESFLRNNRGIGENGGDLPPEVLSGIFERIKQRPFSLKEDDHARERVGASKQLFDASTLFESSSAIFGSNTDDQKREKFKKERDEMMAVTEQLIRRRPGKVQQQDSEENDSAKLTASVAPADVVKPMFDVTWGPMLGILSTVLECSDDWRSVAVCLNGFVYAIRLASHGGMSLARDTFVSSLAKFTFLGSIKEMKRKNVESIRTLLSIAVLDGEHLGESWGPVLQCLSQMSKLRLSASGLDSDESFLLVESPKKSGSRPEKLLRASTTREEQAREAEENNGRVVLEAVHEVLIEKVFSSTVNLSAKSLAHFVEQLIAVASVEVYGAVQAGTEIPGVASKAGGNSNGPSIFSLQRLVDVADFNMDVRPRLVWAQVWELMSDFFVGLACHEKAMVSVFAIDSLKQLSLKFLEKPELSEFNFQSSFLKPFFIVMNEKKSRESVRELVLQCIDNIIRSKAHNLRSGWKTVFSILTLSAQDRSDKIKLLGLDILQGLLDEHINEIDCLAKGESNASEAAATPLENRSRNGKVDDFIHLCESSLSFMQCVSCDSLLPFGSAMRAFCHTTIYADLIASGVVLPPVYGAQCENPDSHGYTYGGLSEPEQLAMVLWRPIFEGLAKGLRSTARASATSSISFVQQGSILALRSILLRHGHLFSSTQLAVILNDTILPSMQMAVESDTSPVNTITSENPSMSTIDFLADALPLPPDHEDPTLQAFLEKNVSHGRAVGPAELMLEACLADLCQGGASGDNGVPDQAFPYSWIATTAPIALGLLTDLASEFVVYRGDEGRALLWPLVASKYKLWAVGPSVGKADVTWTPCEALARVACRELFRLPNQIFADAEFNGLSLGEQESWVSLLLTTFQDILSSSVALEESLRTELLESKDPQSVAQSVEDIDFDDVDQRPNAVSTSFGQGKVMSVRKVEYPDRFDVSIKVIELDFGATLFQPTVDDFEADSRGIPFEVDVPDAYWVTLVPALKIRCVVAHCLHEGFDTIVDTIVPKATSEKVKSLLAVIESSRKLAASTVKNESVSMAFRESLLRDWGDGVGMPDESSETTARLALLHGSDVFFLTQEAGAAKAYIHILSLLYSGESSIGESRRAGQDIAEPLLISFAVDVLDNFLISEERDGHLIDPNIWRRAIEGHGKVALYCTTYAPTIVEILKVIRSLTFDQFEQHKGELYPRICALVRVQSEEIRYMVQDVLASHVARSVGVDVPEQFRRSTSASPRKSN